MYLKILIKINKIKIIPNLNTNIYKPRKQTRLPIIKILTRMLVLRTSIKTKKHKLSIMRKDRLRNQKKKINFR